MRFKFIVSNFILFFLSFAILLALCEITLRISFHETNWYGIGPATKEFYDSISLNSYGFRGAEFPLLKPNGTYRILMVGDSIVFGAGIKNEKDLMSERLRNKLNKDKSNLSLSYDVLNLGGAGSNTIEQTRYLKEKGLILNPDLIIWVFFINDLGEGDQALQYSHFLPFGIGKWLYFNSYTYYFFETRTKNIIEKMGLKKNYGQMMEETVNSGYFFKENKESLDAMLSILDEKEIMVVIFPLLYDLKNYPLRQFHTHLKEYFIENNISVIDLRDYYSEYSEKELIVNDFDLHPNELGHKIAADAIHDHLINKEEYIK